MSVIDSIQQFLNTGGNVLWTILFLSIGLWTLIIAKLLYFSLDYPKQRQQWLTRWQQQPDKHSAHSLSIRQCIISEANISMNAAVPLIRVFVSLCPLLGLLGTVTGMISVFDVMAVTGTGNARAMAAGVSQATIPTMAGMVIAISGLYFSKLIEQRISEETHHLSDLLQYQ